MNSYHHFPGYSCIPLCHCPIKLVPAVCRGCWIIVQGLQHRLHLIIGYHLLSFEPQFTVLHLPKIILFVVAMEPCNSILIQVRWKFVGLYEGDDLLNQFWCEAVAAILKWVVVGEVWPFFKFAHPLCPCLPRNVDVRLALLLIGVCVPL